MNTLVVKIGGGAGLDLAQCLDDLARLASERPLVVVHGVSEMMERLSVERGVPVRMLTSPSGHSSRYTDPETRDLFVEAATRVNHEIVDGLRARGINAVSVLDSIEGERKTALRAVVDGRVRMIRDDYSGTITGVDAAPIVGAISGGFVPVLPPLASSAEGYLNIDGDRAGAAVAGALNAPELVILSNVRGLYRRFPDESSFVERVPHNEIERAMEWAQGRMKRKVLGAAEALNQGVRRAIIADGRAYMPVSSALGGAGTEFVR
jgi:[amino group carrier protein]-L-2-aminoadipate 6-kinase